MTIPLYIASDHAGYKLKTRLIRYIQNELKLDIEDMGAHEYDETDDYPDFIVPAAKKTVETNGRVIVIGGSGNGEAIAANKIPGMRCALGYNIEAAELAMAHNNSNGLSLGARLMTEDHAMAIVKKWLETKFGGDDRHLRRLEQIAALEILKD